MKLNNQKLFSDVLRKLNRLNKSQRHLPDTIGVKRSTLWRLGRNKTITMETFLKLVTWLEREPGIYIEGNRDKRLWN